LSALATASLKADDVSLPAGTRALVLGSGKIGHETNCLGVARALGLEPRVAAIRPRRFFAALAPYGPVDPRDAPNRPGSPLAPPFPDILLASGRVTLPYFRAIKRLSKGRTFAVFLQDPRWSRASADVIWVPEHDRLRGEAVVVTATSPHPLSALALRQARATPDPRVAALPGPRLALALGGPSAVYRFEAKDRDALCVIVRSVAQAGWSVMVTPSRRTPAEVLDALRDELSGSPRPSFVWDGRGGNPYVAMLANAEAVLVTADSVNMLGEALATHAPVYVYEPTGGDARMRGFVDRLVARGQIRRWTGAFSTWEREPVDATIAIARAIAERYRRFRAVGR